MGDGAALSPMSRLVLHALLCLAGDRTNILRSAAGLQTWPGQSRASRERYRVSGERYLASGERYRARSA